MKLPELNLDYLTRPKYLFVTQQIRSFLNASKSIRLGSGDTLPVLQNKIPYPLIHKLYSL